VHAPEAKNWRLRPEVRETSAARAVPMENEVRKLVRCIEGLGSPVSSVFTNTYGVPDFQRENASTSRATSLPSENTLTP